jgi:hypothetical protein
MISKVPLGNSYSILSNFRPIGFIGTSPFNRNVIVGGNLQTSLGAAMGSALRAYGLI